MTINIQFQLFGRGNIQVRQDLSTSFSALLVRVADAIKTRTFHSDEVRDHFFARVDQITQFLNQNHDNTLATSRYVVFPFKAIAVPEHLQDQGYITSLLDTLSVLAFSEPTFEILESHINIKINEKNIFGVYYTAGQLNLVDAYSRVLKCMSEQRIPLPGAFVCIPLNTSGIYALEEEKINNIVTNIVGDCDYIRPLRTGRPKCVSLSSYIINEAETLIAAQAHIRGVLGLE